MKRFLAVLLLLCCAVPLCAKGQGLDDEYVQIFRLIQEADNLSTTAPSQALAKYLDARAALDRLHKGSPEWNTRIVNYRLSYLADRIAALSPASSPAPAATNEPSLGSPPSAAQSAPAVAAPNWQAQATALQDQVGRLQSDKALLEAKLKEALGLRPAAADPAELAKAQAQVRELQKQNELLRLSVEKEKTTPTVPQDSKALEDARRSLADANRQVSEQSARLAKLTLEKEALESRLQHVTQPEASRPNSVGAGTGDKEQLRQLEKERSELQRRLELANRELSGRKRKGTPPVNQAVENELFAARAQLEVLEAKAMPYSAEELQLMKQPAAQLSQVERKSGKESIHALPPGAAAQLAEAQRYFAAKEYDKAEAAYLEVLRQDPKNIAVLGNLAAIQVEAGRFDKADENIQQALALEPGDAYSLYVLGILRFRQGKYDDALGALSRSAKLDPQNAEVQNYLGLALSEKGMRAPAEAALRKAIQLQPGYAGAHYNLAVVYATEQPPATELARWHYQKAIAAGHPRNADLEKKFEARQ